MMINILLDGGFFLGHDKREEENEIHLEKC
jgi:hypothetical protein